MKKYDAIIIGAGPAGMLAAGFLGREKKKVALIEKNSRGGRKLMITGKGRCNVTNNCSPDDFIKFVSTGGKFLYSAINAFTPKDAMEFFEGLGVPLKTERGNRVFPVSDRSLDIVDALDSFSKGGTIDRITNQCDSLLYENGELRGVVLKDKEKIYGENIIIATGGKSYPQTGSTGDGYKFARQAGHTVITPRPSLVPVVTNEEYCREMMGLSLKNVTLSLYSAKKKKPLFSELGEMIFTHFGVSGPLVLSASVFMKEDMDLYRFEIDLKPGLTAEQLDKRLLRDFETNINRDFGNSLNELLPRKLIPVIVKISGIPSDCKINQITKEERARLCSIIKAFKFTPKSLRSIEEAIVTSGGVSVKEINPKTMESKIQKGLYFAGEVIDMDAYTGGFNLQIAYSTAYLAAQAIIN